eukprot:jgi/Tetstr1/449726/TSEL_036793.t1
MAGLPVRASKQAGAVRAAGVPPRAPSGRPPPPDEPAAGPSGNGAGLGGWSRRSSLDGVDSLLQARAAAGGGDGDGETAGEEAAAQQVLLDEAALPRSRLDMLQRSKSCGSELMRPARRSGDGESKPPTRPSSAQLKLAVARGMAAVAEEGLTIGDAHDNILAGMRVAGRLLADHALARVNKEEPPEPLGESLTSQVEGYISDMMHAGRRMAASTLQEVDSEVDSVHQAGVSEGAAAGAAMEAGAPGVGMVGGSSLGWEAATLGTVSGTSSSSDSGIFAEEPEEAAEEDGEGVGGAAGDAGGRPWSASSGASDRTPTPLLDASYRWEVAPLGAAWAEAEHSVAALVGAARDSYGTASRAILDHMYGRLEEQARLAVAPLGGWDSPELAATGASEGGGGGKLVVGPAKGGKGGKRRPRSAARGGDVRLIGAQVGDYRCAAVCGGTVWLADRGGRIEVRSKAWGGAKGSKSAQAPLHTIPAEMDNLVWCMLPVGGRVWVGQEVGPLRVYSMASFELERVLTWHQGGVPCIAATNTGTMHAQRRVFTGSLDFSIVAWNATTCKKEHVIVGHSNGVRCLMVLGSTLWSGSDDHTIRVWDILNAQAAPECIATLEGHTAGVLSLVVAGQGVWSGSADGTIREWSVTGSRLCLRRVENTDRISVLVPMGLNHVWACGQEPSVTVWDTEHMLPVHQLSGHEKWVNMLVKVEHTETRLLWSASMSDRTLRAWEHKNCIDSTEAANVNELSAANEVMGELAQEAALEVGRAADAHLEQLETVAMDATMLADQRQAELEALREQVVDLVQANADAAEREGSLEADLAATRAELAELRERVNVERADNRGLRGDNEALQAEVERLSEAAAAAAARAATAEAEAAAALEELSSLRAAAGEVEEANGATADEAAALRAEAAELRGQLEDLSAQLGEASESAGRLEVERDDALGREEAMRQKYRQLDIFKLDVIARELKRLEGRVKLVRDEAGTLGALAKAAAGGQARQREQLGQLSQRVGTELDGCRGLVRDVIN